MLTGFWKYAAIVLITATLGWVAGALVGFFADAVAFGNPRFMPFEMWLDWSYPEGSGIRSPSWGWSGSAFAMAILAVIWLSSSKERR